MRQEKEYTLICAEIDAEAKETGSLECFFCGKICVKADHHHLDGRDGDRLTQSEWIVRVHRKCHVQYHSGSVESLGWFDGFMLRLKKVSRTLYEKEIWKLEK